MARVMEITAPLLATKVADCRASALSCQPVRSPMGPVALTRSSSRA